MPRRNEALIPLTHDHHHTLAQARRLKEVGKLETDNDKRKAVGDFVNFYFGRAIRHFHEEEELFFAPVIDDPKARDLVVRAVSDHLRLHALVRKVSRQLKKGDTDPELLNEISDLLTEHVRLEENDLFPLIEELVPEEELQDLATVGRRDV